MIKTKHARFKLLTQGCVDGLYRLAVSRLNNLEDAEDVLQETYIKAYRGFEKFVEGTNVKAWMSQILLNVIRDHIRMEARRPQRVPMPDDLQIQSSIRPPDQQLSDQEFDTELMEALQSLPEQFVSPLLLREIQGLSYKQIAATLEIPIGTVMSRLARGRDLLRDQLLKDNDSRKSNDGRYSLPQASEGEK